ncbi:MAG: hypothetical protein ACREM1_06115 [Longimicrobiales bacterium]
MNLLIVAASLGALVLFVIVGAGAFRVSNLPPFAPAGWRSVDQLTMSQGIHRITGLRPSQLHDVCWQALRPSKVQAAAWAAQQFPHWAGLIESALIWRKEQSMSPHPDPSAIAETQWFVAEMTGEIIG